MHGVAACMVQIIPFSLQSYAGKYVPAISYKIDMMNKQSPKLRINLVGLAIGDGLVDPVNVSVQ